MSLNLQNGESCISWTNYTLGLHHGCSMISRACWYCYAKGISHKFHFGVTKEASNGQAQWTGDFVHLPKGLADLNSKSALSVLNDLKKVYSDPKHPDNHKRFTSAGPVLPATVFIDSMSDFFHEKSREDFQVEALESMASQAHKFHFQLLTKRTQRMLEFSKKYPFPDNVWAGTTCETTDKNFIGQNYLWDGKQAVKSKGCPANWFNSASDGVAPWDRPRYLAEVEAKTRFLSVEPMTGPIELPNKVWKKIHWVIIGGESDGKDRTQALIRLCDLKQELNDLLRQCKENKIPVWFKQWGSWDENGNYVGGHPHVGSESRYEWPVNYENILKGV